MPWSLAVGSSQSTNEATNQSTVTVDVYLSWSGGASYYGIGHTGRINIGGVDYTYSAPSTVNYPNPTQSGTIRIDTTSRTITHDANGARGIITTWADLSGGATGYLSDDGPTQPALNYDRKPGAPASCTATLNSDRSVTVNAGNAAAPGGLPALETTYYVEFNRNGEGWTNQQTMTGQAYTYPLSALTPAASYQFRVFAANSDGSSATVTSTGTITIPSGGKFHDGTNWVNTAGLKYNNGADGVWREVVALKTSTGGAWADAL